MNTAERFAASTAKIEDLVNKFSNLFAESNKECKYMTTAESNKIWNTKYKSRYDAMDKTLNAALICNWYTNPNITMQSKRITHRAVVREMRSAGLHRMEVPIKSK